MAVTKRRTGPGRSGSGAMLELVCPGCGVTLELDRGFAGGVCRCSSCGTLMTVPADPAQERAERLVRPDRPTGPGGSVKRVSRPSRPDAPPGSGRPASPPAATRDEPAKPARPDRPDRPARPESPRPAAPKAAALDAEAAPADADTEVYTTESGRVVTVNLRSIPTARKRKIARWTTYAAFGVLIGVLVGAVALAATVFLAPPPDARDRRVGVLETFAYDRDANPLAIGKANVLGLPLRERTVAVVDASAASEAWLPAAEALLRGGLTGHGAANEVEVVYATAAGPRPLLGALTPVSRLTPEAWDAAARPGATGAGSLAAAVDRAVELGGDHVVIVTGRRPEPDELDKLRLAAAAGAGLVVDVVAVGLEVVALDDLARAHDGRYVFLSADELEAWRQSPGR